MRSPGVLQLGVVALRNKNQSIVLSDQSRLVVYLLPQVNICPSYGRSKVNFRGNRRFSTLQDNREAAMADIAMKPLPLYHRVCLTVSSMLIYN